jgi:metal-responsive CopG/Arc/MetJ family transcriptional regulator
MARPVHTRPTGKGERNGKKHLNASLPRQLVFDFNAVAKKQGLGRRDALLEDLLRRFLEKVEPDSKSLRQPPSSPFVLDPPARGLTSKETSDFRKRINSNSVLRVARELAEEILEVTSSIGPRKPPMRTIRRANSERKRSA